MESKTEPRARGTGSIFQNGSAVWWVKYYCRGVPHRESSHSTSRLDAEKLLKRRLAEVMTETYIPKKNVRVDELVRDVQSDYTANGRKSLKHVQMRWKHLAPFFTRMRAADITTDHVRRYITARQEAGAASGTICRELSLLKRALNLATQCTPPKLRVIPYIPMPKEGPPRKGFLELDGYNRLANECGRIGLWMRSLLECGYSFGFRHAELLTLRTRQVDLLAYGGKGCIRLNPGETKNDESREVVLTQPVRELLRRCVHGKRPDDPVFTRDDGSVVTDFRVTWGNVCVRAGLGEFLCPTCEEPVDDNRHCANCGRGHTRKKLRYRGLIFHDLRRTGVRNLVRAGVPERVAMTISGHKTRSVFDRYNIVAPGDLMEAARKLESTREAQSTGPADGQRTGSLAPEVRQPATLNLPN